MIKERCYSARLFRKPETETHALSGIAKYHNEISAGADVGTLAIVSCREVFLFVSSIQLVKCSRYEPSRKATTPTSITQAT